MNLTRKNLDLVMIAAIGLYLDDPYGDGIRLEKIRNPSAARQAALDLVYNRQLVLGGEELIRSAYEHRVDEVFLKSGKISQAFARNFKNSGEYGQVIA